MDKEFLLALVDKVESLHFENTVLWIYVRKYQRGLPPEHEIREIIDAAKADPAIATRVREQFEPVRARIRANETLEQVLQEFLRVVPPQKDMN
jgi:hypothetical protein